MKLEDILKGSPYDLAVFKKYPHHIAALEATITTRMSRKKMTPFVVCLIRKKEIQLEQTPSKYCKNKAQYSIYILNR